ncbi:MAG: hypothetical protein SNJ59_12955 [Aggregatilineales bacterium]
MKQLADLFTFADDTVMVDLRVALYDVEDAIAQLRVAGFVPAPLAVTRDKLRRAGSNAYHAEA